MGKKRVAIIGAGVSGLIGIKTCLDEELEPICLERTDKLGGLWRYEDKVTDGQSCVMKTTVINTSKEMMAFSDFPIPADFPNYMHNTKVMEYFHQYAERFGLLRYIQYKQEIQSVTQAEDFKTTGKWKLRIKDLGTGEEREEIYDAVLVCTGHHADKKLPDFPGHEEFLGKQVHTHDYRNHKGYEDKRVVVVGIGNSGGDVAVELSKICSQVYLSTRRGSWVLNRVGKNGIPSDLLGNRRFVNFMRQTLPESFTNSEMEKRVYLSTRRGSWVTNRVGDYGLPLDMTLTKRVSELVRNVLPDSAFNKIAETKIEQRMNHARYGLRPEHRFTAQHPMVNDELPNRIICGSVCVKPNIRKLSGNTVEFEDGTVVNDVDTIIYATGFVFGFPFISKDIIEVVNNKVNLFKYCFPPDLSHSTLAVIGFIQPWGAIMPIAELQSRWATRVFKGVGSLPPRDVMWDDIRGKQESMARRYVESTRHTIQVDWIPFMDEVAEQAGCKPDLWQLLRSDPRLALTCFFGPCTPYQYRLMGPLPWKGARQAIMTQWDRAEAPLKTRPCNVPPSSSSFMKYIFLAVIVAIIYMWLF